MKPEEARAELGALAASLRAFLEWHQEAGTIGFARRTKQDGVGSLASIGAGSVPDASASIADRSTPAVDPPPSAADPSPPAADPSPTAAAPIAPIAKPAQVRLPQLESEVAACTRCGLAATRTQTVFARGNPQATLCFVGEALRGRRGCPRSSLRRPRRPTARPDDHGDGTLAGTRRLYLQHHQVPAAGQSTARARRDRDVHSVLARTARTRSPARHRRDGQHRCRRLTRYQAGHYEAARAVEALSRPHAADADISPVVFTETEPPANRGETPGLAGFCSSRYAKTKKGRCSRLPPTPIHPRRDRAAVRPRDSATSAAFVANVGA